MNVRASDRETRQARTFDSAFGSVPEWM